MLSLMNDNARANSVFVIACLYIFLLGCNAPQQSHLREQWAKVQNGSQDFIHVEDQLVTNRDLELLPHCKNLRELLIENSSITDEGICVLADLPALEHLRIRGASVGNRGLAHLVQFSTIRVLNLPQAHFTDEGLAALSELPKLELLRIGSPEVSDSGMAHIAKLKQLRFLHLIGVPITDAGLEQLHELKQLESLYLDDTKVTDAGIGRLLSALPDVHFHINQQHHDRDPKRHSHAR